MSKALLFHQAGCQGTCHTLKATDGRLVDWRLPSDQMIQKDHDGDSLAHCRSALEFNANLFDDGL